MKIEGWVGIVNLKLKLTDIKTGSSGHLAWKNDMSVIGGITQTANRAGYSWK